MKLPTIQMEEIDHLTAGEKIRKARLAAGLSLRKMASQMGYSAPFVSDLELGRRNWTENTFKAAESVIARWAKARRK